MIAFLFAAESTSSSSSGGLGSLLLFPILFAAMYFLLIRPQRKRQKETNEIQKSIVVGDEVVLNSGILGFISAIDDDGIVWLDIADGHGSERIEIRITRGAIARKTTPASGASETK